MYNDFTKTESSVVVQKLDVEVPPDHWGGTLQLLFGSHGNYSRV
jgi:hypothetical protein